MFDAFDFVCSSKIVTINFEQILRNGIFARAQHSDAYSRDGVVNSCGDLSPIQSIFP